MKIDIWLDDVRQPPDDGWVWVETAEEAIDLMTILGMRQVGQVSLDHDLGIPLDSLKFTTGYDVVCWMELSHSWPELKPIVHSANPVGAARMRQGD